MLTRRRTSVTDLNYHLVFVTKYRKQVFTTDHLREEMLQILGKIASGKGVVVQRMEVMSDHVHMLISFHPKEAPSSVVKSLKGVSAREWFKRHPETKKTLWGGHLWSGSFFMSTVGNVSKDVVDAYIRDQMDKMLRQR